MTRNELKVVGPCLHFFHYLFWRFFFIFLIFPFSFFFLVAEAKARKKLKAKRRIDKLKARANHIAVDNELSEVAKARQIEKLYKSQMAKMKSKQVYVVRRKFQKGLQRIGPKRTVGTKVKVVDKRMKADKRGMTAQRRRSS